MTTVIDGWWSDDGRLLAALAAAVRAARDVPPGLAAAARELYEPLDLDAELLKLVRGWQPAPLTRGEPPTHTEPAQLRAVTFASARVRIHLQVDREALRGQVVPVEVDAMELLLAGADTRPVPVAIDEVGWFVVRPVPAGRFRLRCRLACGLVAVTAWTVI